MKVKHPNSVGLWRKAFLALYEVDLLEEQLGLLVAGSLVPTMQGSMTVPPNFGGRVFLPV